MNILKPKKWVVWILFLLWALSIFIFIQIIFGPAGGPNPYNNFRSISLVFFWGIPIYLIVALVRNKIKKK